MNIIKFLRKPYLALLLASLTLFASCSQYDNDVVDSNMINSFDKTQRMLTNVEIDKIGVEHNEYLNNLLVNKENKRISSISELKENIMDKYPQLLENTENVNSVIDNSISLNINDFDLLIDKNENLVNNPTLLKEFVNKTTTLTNKYRNYKEYQNSLEKLELEAKDRLIGIDLDTYLVFTSVYKNSTKFWFEDGNYEHYVDENSRASRSAVATADGLAAGIGFLTLAAVTSALVIAAGSGGLATPAVVIVAELLGIGFSSALSSGAVILGIV